MAQKPASWTAKIPGITCRAMFEKVSFAMADDESKHTEMKGVLLHFRGDRLTVVATDGARMSLFEVGVPAKRSGKGAKSDEVKIVVPRQAVEAIECVRFFTEGEIVRLRVHSDGAEFGTARWKLTTPLIEERYPDYKSVIPVKLPTPCVVHLEALLDLVKRVHQLTRPGYRRISIGVSGGVLELGTVYDQAAAYKENLPVEYKGANVSTQIDSAYVLDVLRSMPFGPVRLYVHEKSPMVIAPVKEALGESAHIIMPLIRRQTTSTPNERT